MLNIKKTLATVFGVAMVVSTLVVSAISVHADGYTPTLTTSSSETGDGAAYIRLNVSGLASASGEGNNFTSDGAVWIKVKKDLFVADGGDAPAAEELGKAGLCYNSRGKAPTWSIALNTTESKDYDVLQIGWYGENACFTANGDIVDVVLVYKSGDVEATDFEILADKSVITITDASGNKLTQDGSFVVTTSKYKMAVDGTVTPDTTPAYEDTTPGYVYNGKDTDWGAATYVNEFTGTAGDTAVAVKAEVKPGHNAEGTPNAYTGLVWKATKTDGTEGIFEHAATISGDATYVYGLIINGATKDDIKTDGFGIAVK